MNAWVEPRLLERLQAAGADDLLEAVIAVRELFPIQDEGGGLRQLVARAAAASHSPPVSARYFPRAGAAVLTANRAFWMEILRDEELFAAASVSVSGFMDRTPVPF